MLRRDIEIIVVQEDIRGRQGTPVAQIAVETDQASEPAGALRGSARATVAMLSAKIAERGPLRRIGGRIGERRGRDVLPLSAYG